MKQSSNAGGDRAIRWARTTHGPITFGEIDARLVHADSRLARAVHDSLAKHTDGGLPDPPPMGPRGWGNRRLGLWALLVLLPTAALFALPSRHTRTSAAAERFFNVTYYSFLAVDVMLLLLFAAWLVNPVRWFGTRLTLSLVTLSMLLTLPLPILVLAALDGIDDWLVRSTPLLVSTALVAANLWATFSARTRTADEVAAVDWLMVVLRHDPDEADASGARGPVRELRHVVRRLSAADRSDLDRRRSRVLAILRERDLVSATDARQAAALPLGCWHELDPAPDS